MDLFEIFGCMLIVALALFWPLRPTNPCSYCPVLADNPGSIESCRSTCTAYRHFVERCRKEGLSHDA